MTDARAIYSPNTGTEYSRWRPTPRAAIERTLEDLATASAALAADIDLRKQVLTTARDALLNAKPELAERVVEEVGKKPDEALAEVDYAISFIDYALTLLGRYEFTHSVERGRWVREVSLGPALLICPFNDPLAGITRKLAPAVAAGSAVLVKPSPLASDCAATMLRALTEAGAVSNSVHAVYADQPPLLTDLIRDARIGMVSFTGSTEVGREVAVTAAGCGKKAVLELGGNCPFVIFDNANLPQALDDLLSRKLKAAGQACSSVNRVYVASAVYDDVKARLLSRVAKLRLGPSTEDVDLGPVRSAASCQRLLNALATAQTEGANLLTEHPQPPKDKQAFLFPLSVLETDNGRCLPGFESFGPLLILQRFDDPTALLAQLAQERHALVAYFYTADPQALQLQLDGLRFGSVGLNSTAVQGPHLPTGGFFDAGCGREGGVWGLREFLTTVNYHRG